VIRFGPKGEGLGSADLGRVTYTFITIHDLIVHA
jgi:hypothetical protein